MRTVWALVLSFALLLSLGASASAQAKAGGARSAEATLKIRVVGLPRGERGVFTLLGPRQSPHGGQRLRRRLHRRGASTLGGLRPGLYRVKVSRVRLRGSSNKIKRGAVAFPVKRKLRFRLKAGGGRIDVRYGTIVNPGVRDVSGKVSRVLGDKVSPTGVVLRRGTPLRRGAILSARPSALLPQGLLARVTGLRYGPRLVTAYIRPASIYDVAPNMSFNVPLSDEQLAQGSGLVKCGSELRPYVKVGDVRLTGGWTTTRVLFADITTGAEAKLTFRAGVGVRVSAAAPVSCKLQLPAFTLQGMAGPIPVYGGIRPGAKAELGAAGKLYSEGSADITLGARIGAVPPTATPVLGFSSPRFTVGAELFAGLKAGLSLDAELGIGAANAANLHLTFGNSLDFVASPGNCSWDLNLGTFSGGGKLGPFDVVTPSSPPLFHKNLWHAPCGSPPPPPPPPPPPSITLPFARATMTWDTDSDIDLYAWDTEGNLTYFGEQLGIPDAELIEDIIPSEGDVFHPAEIFQETASPGRTYTFGICDYRGEGANVSLAVNDPNGGTRNFARSLVAVGDSAVITTSPEGPGYLPEAGWCRDIEG